MLEFIQALIVHSKISANTPVAVTSPPDPAPCTTKGLVYKLVVMATRLPGPALLNELLASTTIGPTTFLLLTSTLAA